MAPAPRSALSRMLTGLTLAAALALGGCVINSPFEDLDAAQPSGSAFSQAQFKDYAFLARSFGVQDAPAGNAFDSGDSVSLGSVSSEVADVANAYAAKALIAARGEEPLPEPAPTDNAEAEAMRLRLLRALSQSRTKAPVAAARAQADFDCWVMNGAVDELAAAAAQCRAAFKSSLARIEHAPPPPAPAPVAAAPVDFTALFGLGSATVTPEGMAVLRQAIETARAGRQSRITVVGHTDTVGTPEYNLALSRKRANAVKAALVQMGARAAAIQISGVGENDLAVDTPNGVNEPKNRRGVVTLEP